MPPEGNTKIINSQPFFTGDFSKFFFQSSIDLINLLGTDKPTEPDVSRVKGCPSVSSTINETQFLSSTVENSTPPILITSHASIPPPQLDADFSEEIGIGVLYETKEDQQCDSEKSTCYSLQQKLKQFILSDLICLDEFISEAKIVAFLDQEKIKKILTLAETHNITLSAIAYEYMKHLQDSETQLSQEQKKFFKDLEYKYGVQALIYRKLTRFFHRYYPDTDGCFSKLTAQEVARLCPALLDEDVREGLLSGILRTSDILPAIGWGRKIIRGVWWLLTLKLGRFVDGGKTLSLPHALRILRNQTIDTILENLPQNLEQIDTTELLGSTLFKQQEDNFKKLISLSKKLELISEEIGLSSLKDKIKLCELLKKTAITGEYEHKSRLFVGGMIATCGVASSITLCFAFLKEVLPKWNLSNQLFYPIAGASSISDGVADGLSRWTSILRITTYKNKAQKLKGIPYIKLNWINSHTIKCVLLRAIVYFATISEGLTAYFGIHVCITAILAFFGGAALISNPIGWAIITVIAIGISVAAAVSFFAFQGSAIEDNFDGFIKLFVDTWKGNKENKCKAFLKLTGLTFLAFLLGSVYAVITYYTTISGLGFLGQGAIAVGVALASTFANVLVTTATQVYAVCDLLCKTLNYGNLRNNWKKVKNHFFRWHELSIWQQIKTVAAVGLLPFIVALDTFAYCVVGSFDSSSSVALFLGIPATPIIVVASIVFTLLSLAFIWTPVFQRCITTEPHCAIKSVENAKSAESVEKQEALIEQQSQKQQMPSESPKAENRHVESFISDLPKRLASIDIPKEAAQSSELTNTSFSFFAHRYAAARFHDGEWFAHTP